MEIFIADGLFNYKVISVIGGRALALSVHQLLYIKSIIQHADYQAHSMMATSYNFYEKRKSVTEHL